MINGVNLSGDVSFCGSELFQHKFSVCKGYKIASSLGVSAISNIVFLVLYSVETDQDRSQGNQYQDDQTVERFYKDPLYK